MLPPEAVKSPPSVKLPAVRSIVPEVKLMLPAILLAVPTMLGLPALFAAVLVTERVPPPIETVPAPSAPTPEPVRAIVPLFKVVPPA